MKRDLTLLTAALVVSWSFAHVRSAEADPPEIVVIKPEVQSHLANGGWKYDRYKEMQSLDAGKRMTIADLKGPGIVRSIHITRHPPEETASRGVVLEIWFDGADEPAVMCPLADFFGDGCNGQGMDFTSKFIECAPWNYNCYFPMPFKSSARVTLRNDTDKNIMNYSYVEWDTLPQWKEGLGYFHATYARKSFQLTKETDETFFEVQGTGHVLGRQFSIITDEPLFCAFQFVMEGNNEIDIDGHKRQLDYLGTECSFGFCWGFRNPFVGLRCGMTLVKNATGKPEEEPKGLNLLSAYRFNDHMPIRFNKSLRWHINWKNERFFTAQPQWPKAVENDGCWVDYATVHYWYQATPAGFQHIPLPAVAERQKPMLRPNKPTPAVD